MAKKSRFVYYGLIIFASLAWAGSFSVGSDLMENCNPYTISLIRGSVSSLALLLAILINKKPLRYSDLKVNFWIILAMAVTGVTGYYVLSVIGLQYVDAGKSSLINSINPGLIVLLSALFFKEPLSKRRLWGTLISFIGVLIVVISNNKGLFYGLKFYPHDLYFFATGTLITFYTLFNRLLGNRIDYMVGLFWCFFIGTLTIVPFAAPYLTDIYNYGLIQWLEVIFLGLICGALCDLIWYESIMVIGAGNCGLINSFSPLFAVIIAWLFLGEKITPVLLVGAVLVVFGVWQGVSAMPVIDKQADNVIQEEQTS